MSFLLYNISIHLYGFLIRITSPFNIKARKWISGRKDLLNNIREQISPESRIVWFHCASLGEFEQGRPLIEKFKSLHPEYRILLTFFSPSGYEIRKNWELADHIFYLPIDTARNARAFIDAVRPERVFFIKYEYWYNYIHILHLGNIPVYVVSAIFRPGHIFFKWYGKWFRKQLKKISWFFVQNKSSVELLEAAGIKNSTISGDTRFDRVFQIVNQKRSFPEIEQFCKNSPVFVAGSTWPADESRLQAMVNSDTGIKYIIAPHEINRDHINSFIAGSNKKVILYSSMTAENIPGAEVLIIDTIGILSHLYRYASISYIGGGFGKGIHNILEAVTFGKPVIFGPNYQKFQEARDLIDQKGAFEVNNGKEITEITQQLLHDQSLYTECADTCKQYIKSKIGATQMILDQVFKKEDIK